MHLSPPEARRDAIRSCLDELLTAHLYADSVSAEPISFAVEIQSLHHRGVSNADVRWLLIQGIVRHFRETLQMDSVNRRLVETKSHIMDERSCFLLTGSGLDFASNALDGSPTSSRPTWNPSNRELWFEDSLIKRFRSPARNQEAVLMAFEEMKWPTCIDDPLPPIMSQDSKSRIQETIKSLNRRHVVNSIRFCGNGEGTGVRWQPIE